ncbi:tryptophan synthase subunit alpha [Solimicrobium silvestre]|uniref:Tryptophan synthase alpha chain n=1 Tax=Solimicrobium silvestre TaxID=2099400 RepID=A0A2S9GZJ6_9BURK|nr:tryptophan synthase subunit alpha [Solimicrobium silvestre]PRC93159.1 trpA: tryptophan synthase, alpha subunit [Solimicrobium silvestre]
MSRIKNTFAELAKNGRKGLIPFITAGDPSPAITVQLMHALVRGGADIIELGVPFSDPMADGPVIQRASERALKHGVGLIDVLQCVREFRASNKITPVVLMGYANPIERMGIELFVSESANAGVDGVLVVDYPPEECVAYAACMKKHGLDVIFLLAPTSTDQRIAQVAQIASGYVYYVSLKGVTGNNAIDLSEVNRMLPKIKQHVQVPVAVGFGVRDAATAKLISHVADAVVIGSRIIQEIETHDANLAPDLMLTSVQDFLSTVRQAMNQ